MFLITAVNTTAILSLLRGQMMNSTLDAYIIPYSGPHYDENLAACDARIERVSGFDGSNAFVVVSKTNALLWTDGRYFLRANQTLDNNWTLMKEGQIGVPTPTEWLLSNLLPNSRVGFDPKTLSKDYYDKLLTSLSTKSISLVSIAQNLVDKDWTGQPPRVANNIFELPISFSGRNVSDKLADIRKIMSDEGADLLVLSELDDIAWTFNLRGSDYPQASVFFSFALITNNSSKFYVQNSNQINATLVDALRRYGVEVIAKYSTVRADLVLEVPKYNKTWLSKYVNSDLANAVPSTKQLIKLSPVSLLKSIKNNVEVEGMRNAHLKDSLAIISFFSWLEDEIVNKNVKNITEISASEKIIEFREKGDNFVKPSFNTIAGYGSNGAVIHYRPANETNKNISNDGLFLLDSGGLYWDGTTDITRTIHLGEPTEEQKDSFTRVLKGHIEIARAVFPNKIVGARLDSFARRSLWEAKKDYGHGTGHGIGHFLNVHEGPQRISYGVSVDDSGLQENMFVSNEPGFYKDNEYGIRIENIVRIAKSNTDGFLEIETVSYVPIQLKLVDDSILSQQEIEWLDNYHKMCRERISELLKANTKYTDAEKMSIQKWLDRDTRTLSEFKNSSPSLIFSTSTILSLTIVQFIFSKILLF